ncbi:MAG TPA: PLDc N-terminal domain-containing protein [Actinomycetaceae bacterium]|nr:PLDc N-terminal domain-containing protein [Actinomycetaceae bacterium]
MARVLPVVLAVALWIYGLIDCAQTPEDRMPPGLAKPVWLLIILLVPGVGAVAWLVVKGIAAASTDGPGQGPVRRKKRGPIAPDDDAEFLANLDWQARKAHHERLRREKEAKAAAEGRTAEGRAAEGQAAEGRAAEGQAAERREEDDALAALEREFRGETSGTPAEASGEAATRTPDDPDPDADENGDAAAPRA